MIDFTGKVMLFYGISLILKEKSNASALVCYQRRTNLGPATNESGSRRARSWPQTRSSLLPRALIITMTDFPLQLFISTSNLTSFKAVLLLCLSLGAERSLQCLSDAFDAVVEMDAMRFDGGTVHRQVPFLVAESVGIRQYPF